MSALPESSRMRGRRVVALSGGVGGARFLHGLARVVDPERLTIVVNTGDDFEHWGLSISPDVDTVMYTLANLAHEERGWGLSEETFHALEMIRRYGGEDWFALGDRDLATHLVRTQALARGETLSRVTARLCKALGVGPTVLPMADGPCRTRVDTKNHGTLSFQDWFVRHRAVPVVRRIWFEGAPPPAPGVLDALKDAELVVIGPSNPYVSIDPILCLSGVRAAVSRRPVLAVSPIVHGQAIKGPLARMIGELAGRPPTPQAIQAHYDGMLAAMVVERGDDAFVTGIPVCGTETVMRTRDDSLRLAREVLSFAESILP